MGVFGTIEVRTNQSPAREVSKAFLGRLQQEKSGYAECDDAPADCDAPLRSWRAELDKLRQLSGDELLAAVNTYVNRIIEHKGDGALYGEEDYWATPAESLRGYGDCEDFAILKYVTLRELGFSDQQLRVVVVWDEGRELGHAIVAVNLGGRTYMLDSLSPDVKAARTHPHYTPVYSWNQSQHWLNVAVRDRASRVASTQSE